MPRRKSVNIIRDVGVDPRYKDNSLQKFINVVMWRGKKNTARKLVYGALDIIAKKLSFDNDQALEVFKKAIENTIPAIEVRARRVGGGVYQIPVEVTENRGRAISFRGIIKSAKDRPGKNFSEKLSAELLEAADNKGGAIKLKLEKHKMAEANRAFSHLAW